MLYSLQIKESHGPGIPWRFTQEFQTQAEFDQVNALCINRWRGNLLTQSFMVMRTDTLNHFIEDFFFPNVIGALKIKDLASKIFLIITHFFFDLAFFPIRCLTLIPRYLWNRIHSRENHPLHQYLVQQGADPVLLHRDSLFIAKKKFTFRPQQRFDFDRTQETFNYIGLPNHINQTATNRLSMKAFPMEHLQILKET